jgi:hypothetical protein
MNRGDPSEAIFEDAADRLRMGTREYLAFLLGRLITAKLQQLDEQPIPVT